MRFNAFRESKEKQLNGVAVPFGDATFYIRRWGTRESELFIADLRRELFGPFSDLPEYTPELIAYWLAEYGVAGWDGVLDEDSEGELKYSKVLARKIFTDESYWLELNAQLFKEAQNYEHFLGEIAKEDSEAIKK
jgi:hypothetical protein